MPVWHERTKELVAAGELTVVGITQEQHPDRCALFAQWKGLDFPILWDPFGVTGLEVVPVLTGIDEHGVVRVARPRIDDFEEGFVRRTFEPPGAGVARPPGFRMVEDRLRGPGSSLAALLRAPGDRATLDAGIEALSRAAAAAGSPRVDFALGVAHRLRFDTAHARAGDFGAAVGAWAEALAARPNQYIWRRRIQQWGPRLDKPYPFYDWVQRARTEIAARGGSPVELRVPLSGSEVAGRRGDPGTQPVRPVPGAPEPDPKGKIERDRGALVTLEAVAVPDTDPDRGDGAVVRVHLRLTPVRVEEDGDSGAKWALDTYAPALWVESPEGWTVPGNLWPVPWPAQDEGEAELSPIAVDFGVKVPASAFGEGDDAAPPTLSGYVVYSVCLADGTCVFRRQDLEVTIERPR